jgi:hypothetical protein
MANGKVIRITQPNEPVTVDESVPPVKTKSGWYWLSHTGKKTGRRYEQAQRDGDTLWYAEVKR